MTFNSLRLFDYRKVALYRNKVAEINRSFGLFYAGRYNDAPANNESDFQRAVVYLERARDEAEPDVSISANGDLGVLFVGRSEIEESESSKASMRRLAESYFALVLERNKTEPKSLLGLAWIQKRDGRLRDAIASATRVIEKREWQEQERIRYLRKAYFNRACYLVLARESGQGTETTANFWSAMQDLHASRVLALKHGQFNDWLIDLERELKASGDLAALQPEYGPKLDEMRRS
ncbi:MAG: hypothetical protein WB992_17380 [Bryobacteraceae bacterium]